MGSSVINININAVVRGKKDVGKLTEELSALGLSANRAAQDIAKMDFHKLVTGCGAFSLAVQGLVNSFGSMSEGYKSFDTAMRATNTMAGKSEKGFEGLKDKVTELAKAVPMARDELANGLYQVISNGVPEDNWLSFLEASAKSAVGGMADLGGVVTVTSTIIKNYGMSWNDALAIQDKIQTTAKNGVTSFEQLQQALPKVTGNAATLGVTIDELMASFATLTGVSGNTAEVSTQLAAIFTALVKPSSSAAKMAAEMGVQFDAAAIKAAGGFQNFIQNLDSVVQAYAQKSGMLTQEIYAQLFGSAESLRALIPLTGELASKYAENVNAMAGSTGAIGDAFSEMSQTAEAKAQLVKNAWANVTDAIGKGAARIKPALDFGASFGMAVSGITAVGGALALVRKQASAFAKSLNTAVGSMDMAGQSSKALSLTLRALPFAAAAAAIGLAVTATLKYIDTTATARKVNEEHRKTMEALRNTQQSVAQSASEACASEMSRIDLLVRVIGDETKARETRLAALNEMQSKYPEYFGNLSLEKLSVEQLQTAYEGLKTKILEAAKARAAQSKLEELSALKLAKEERLRQITEKGGELDKARLAQEEALDNQRRAGQSNIFTAAGGSMGAMNSSAMVVNRQAAKAQDEVNGLVAEEKGLHEEIAEIEKQQAFYAEAAEEAVTKSLKTSVAAAAAPSPGASSKDKNKKKKAEDEIPDLEEVVGRDLKSLADFDKALQDLQKIYSNCSQDMVGKVREQISRVKDLRKEFEGLPEAVEAPLPTLEEVTSRSTTNISEIDKAIADLTKLRLLASETEIEAINKEIAAYEKKKKAMLGLGLPNDKSSSKSSKSPVSSLREINKAWGGISTIESGVENLTKVVSENASAWERVSAAINGVLGLINGLDALCQAFSKLGAVSLASAAEQQAAAANTTAAANADATAQLADAAAKTFNAHSWIPWVGVGLAAASVAMMIATMAGLPKFADGCIAYGPTLGLFGEYAGASSNPEVVAPLDRLKDLVGDPGGVEGHVEFEIRGDRLYGVLKNYDRKYSRV